MIILLSPSKTQEAVNSTIKTTIPSETKKTKPLISALKSLSLQSLKKQFSLSDALAEKIFSQLQQLGKKSLTPALFQFQGDVFQKLDAFNLSKKSLLFSEKHLIILSALYGYLKPLDGIQPYRLDMQDNLPGYENLYHYWKDSVTTGLNTLLEQHKNKVILNLASNEYFKMLDLKKLDAKVVQVDFKVKKEGAYKTIGIYAKRGRGLLTRYILENQIDDAEDFIDFKAEGFSYCKPLSTQEKVVFAS